MQLGQKVTSVEYLDLGVELQTSKGVQVQQADACNLPLPSNSFDLVVCRDVIEHIAEENEVVSEIFRVLKHQGRFIIWVPVGNKL